MITQVVTIIVTVTPQLASLSTLHPWLHTLPDLGFAALSGSKMLPQLRSGADAKQLGSARFVASSLSCQASIARQYLMLHTWQEPGTHLLWTFVVLQMACSSKCHPIVPDITLLMETQVL